MIGLTLMMMVFLVRQVAVEAQGQTAEATKNVEPTNMESQQEQADGQQQAQQTQGFQNRGFQNQQPLFFQNPQNQYFQNPQQTYQSPMYRPQPILNFLNQPRFPGMIGGPPPSQPQLNFPTGPLLNPSVLGQHSTKIIQNENQDGQSQRKFLPPDLETQQQAAINHQSWFQNQMKNMQNLFGKWI